MTPSCIWSCNDTIHNYVHKVEIEECINWTFGISGDNVFKLCIAFIVYTDFICMNQIFMHTDFDSVVTLWKSSNTLIGFSVIEMWVALCILCSQRSTWSIRYLFSYDSCIIIIIITMNWPFGMGRNYWCVEIQLTWMNEWNEWWMLLGGWM